MRSIDVVIHGEDKVAALNASGTHLVLRPYADAVWRAVECIGEAAK